MSVANFQKVKKLFETVMLASITGREARGTHKKSGVPLHTAENKTHSIV